MKNAIQGIAEYSFQGAVNHRQESNWSWRWWWTSTFPDLPGSDDPIAGDPDVDLNPVTEEMFSSWALFIMLLLLISALWSSYYLTQKRIRAVHETVLSIFYGMVIGLIIRMSPGIIFKIRLLLIHPTSLMFYCRQLF